MFVNLQRTFLLAIPLIWDGGGPDMGVGIWEPEAFQLKGQFGVECHWGPRVKDQEAWCGARGLGHCSVQICGNLRINCWTIVLLSKGLQIRGVGFQFKFVENFED